MKTTLHFEPTTPAIKTLDLQIADLLKNLNPSLYDGSEYKITISDSKALFKPYRTIHIGGLNGFVFIDIELQNLGFKNQLPEGATAKGFDAIYTLN